MAGKLELRGVHVFQKQQNSGAFVLASVNPYLRLSAEDGVLYIQNGQVFSEEGKAIPEDKLPGWFKAELTKCTKQALRECGWKTKE